MSTRPEEERRIPYSQGSKPLAAKRRPPEMSSRPPRRRSDGFVVRLLQILGLGLFGFLALMLSRQPRRPRRGHRPPADHEPESEELWPDEAAPETSHEPSVDDNISWIAGPTGDLRILERHPQGEITLLLIHGLAGRLEHWLPLLDRTGPALRCLAVDLPGHGASDCHDGSEVSVLDMAQAMRAVLETLGLRRVLVVGHDLGATVALQLAAMAPERVLGLFLIDPNGDQSRLAGSAKASVLEAMEKDPHDEVRWQFRQILLDDDPQLADRVLADIEDSRASALLGAVRSSLEFEPAAALATYGGPCRVLISPLNDLPYSLHKIVPDLPCTMLPQASHWMMMDTPQRVWESLVDFLDQIVDRLIPDA